MKATDRIRTPNCECRHERVKMAPIFKHPEEVQIILTQQPRTLAPILPAELVWNNETPPVSTEYGDVYFSKEKGVQEKEHVFLNSNAVVERWNSHAPNQKPFFTIAETGFGTGLNFFVTWRAWQQRENTRQRLHYISVEKHPLRPEDLLKVITQQFPLQPAMIELAQALICQYPPLVPGMHRIEFHEERISLTLLFGDAAERLQDLEASVDAWYLDGFAPPKNPDMWNAPLFKQIKRLSHEGTTFSTYTVAGVVRRGMTEVGFEVSRSEGFGLKREMYVGKFKAPDIKPVALHHTEQPWYHLPTPLRKNAKLDSPPSVLVIGGGLAGAATAFSLAKRGWKVSVAEQANALATQASGNPAGVTFTKFSCHNSPQNRFYQQAYLYTTRVLNQLLPQSSLTAGQDYALNGVIRLAFSGKEAEEQTDLLASGLWPSSITEAMDAQALSKLTGFTTTQSGLFLKGGGWINPAALIQLFLDHPAIRVNLNTEVTHLCTSDAGWQAQTPNGRLTPSIRDRTESEPTDFDVAGFDAVVIANSFGATQIPITSSLPLRSVRGQITYVPQTEASTPLQHALNYNGYTTPARDGFHCVGATFHPKLKSNDFRAEDHAENLNNLNDSMPGLAASLNLPTDRETHPLDKGRVAFRCQTPDYLPLVGPVPVWDKFNVDYAHLRKGFLRRPFPVASWHSGLFTNLAHGSRGITSTLFSAEILASYITGEPFPIDQEVLHALHPARFALRDLKRNKI